MMRAETRGISAAGLFAVVLLVVALIRTFPVLGSEDSVTAPELGEERKDELHPRFVAALAQRGPFPQPPRGGADVLVQADRQSVRRLRTAQELIGRKQYLEGLELLQRVLDREKDAFFYPDPEKRDVLQSLRVAAQRLLASMPKDGREAYQLKFGQKAALDMEDALKAGRLDGLTDIARRYFHTQAGYEAMYRLGIVFQDRGEPLAAGLCFERLRDLPEVARTWEPTLSLRAALCWNRAGLTEKSRKALAGFRQHNGDRVVNIQGQSIRPFAKPEDGAAWLTRHFGAPQKSLIGEREWFVHRGNAERNGVALLPKQADAVTWKLSTIVDPLDETADIHEKVSTANIKTMAGIVKSLDVANRQQADPALPAVHPLVIDGTVIVRKLGFLRAIELKTGTRLWETIPDENLVMRLRTEGDSPAAVNSRLMSSLVKQWTWHDVTRGTLSSDGRRVYAIEETEFATPTFDPESGERTIPTGGNRLFAYDLQTGRFSWPLGGTQDDRQPVDPLAGTFFLGPPLPLAGRLYVLAETNGEIELMALEHREEGTGNVRRQWLERLWTQPLVSPNRRITQDWSRRTAGASISYADGIMVCCTEAGFVIGVDLTSRSLLWAYRYEEQNVPFPGPFPRPGPPQQRRTGWAGHAAVIANGKVLLTPQGSAELHCLNLIDGTVAWKKPQGDGRYVAGVTAGKVLVVGKDSVLALNLVDGKTAWKAPAKISTPSGQGLIAGDRLFVPTTTDGIVLLDVASGKLLGKTKLPGDRRPGNLLLSGGTMISQSVDSIEAFPVPGVADSRP